MDGAISTQSPAAPGETDHLAASVLRSLGRSFRNQFSLSGSKAGALGLVTFGIWPLWQLSRQFSDYVIFERQQLWHLAEWLRLRRGSDEAMALHNALKPMRPNPLLTLGAVVGVGLFVAAVFLQLHDSFSLRALLNATYLRHRAASIAGNKVWAAWVVGLSLGYLCQAAQVALHQRRVERFARRFNKLALREGVEPVPTPRLRTGLNLEWIVPAVLLTWAGAVWSVPMALAGASQRAYINDTATRLRAHLLDRVREVMQQQRPAVAVPSYVIHGRRCDNPLCRANLKAGARYCARCGAASGLASEVA